MQDTAPQNPTKGPLPRVSVAQINPSGLPDVPTAQDRIGFKPYVRAVGWFLSAAETKPPLTLSIEGPWGSGKSSFMLQLEEELKALEPANRNQYYIRFNAWRSDKDEALWAAFALTFMKEFERQIDFKRRIGANFDLLLRRVEWRRDCFKIAQFTLVLICFVGLTIYAAIHPDILAKPDAATLLVGAPWLASLWLGLDKSKKLLGNPLSYDIAKSVRNLKYEDRVAFIDRFQNDFSDIIKSYAGDNARIFVFIDDLDRCEVPKAAELLQAINLLLSADQGNLFFILGLDREMVAAGIAAKNEKVLPYLAAGRANQPEKTDFHQVGIEYGYAFMEKFVQVPFRVPSPAENEINSWVKNLTGLENPSATLARGADGVDIRAGSDPEQFQDVVERMAELFEFNPRRLKQFINLFRLRVMIALSTDVLMPMPEVASGSSGSMALTIPQLGLFTAVLMRWSRLAGDLIQKPDLFTCLSEGDQPEDELVKRWSKNAKLLEAIDLDSSYTLTDVDLRPLLMIMPDAYTGVLGERDPKLGPTQLIGTGAAAIANTAPETGTSAGPSRTPERSPAFSPPDSSFVRPVEGPTGPSATVVPSTGTTAGPTFTRVSR